MFASHHLHPEMRAAISVEFHHESPTAFGLHLENMIALHIHSHHFSQVIESIIFSGHTATWNTVYISQQPLQLSVACD